MFAKVFETAHGQLLVTKEWDDENEGMPWQLKLRGEDVNGVEPSLSVCFPQEATRDVTFDEYDQEAAERGASELSKVLLNLMNGTEN